MQSAVQPKTAECGKSEKNNDQCVSTHNCKDQPLASLPPNYLEDCSDSDDDDVSEIGSFALEQDLEDDDDEEEEGEVKAAMLGQTSKFLLSAEGHLVDEQELRACNVDPETQARLEALLEAAGIGKMSAVDGKQFADPEILKRLTSSVSCALDEAAAALTRMRQEHTSQSEGQRSIVEACSDGDVGAVRRLLDEGRSINETTEEGESLLSLACSAGYYELAQVLLAMKANVEDRGIKGDCTPLMEAASAGHVDIVKLLLMHGADCNAQSSSNNTPLMYACASGHAEVVKALLEAGANVEDHNENGHTPLMEAASAGHVGVAKILLEQGAGINTHSNEFKESALTLACYKGHLDMVRFLLEAGADQEHKTDEMHTALMEASMDGHVEVARLLLDSGAQVNMPADSFESPLTLAACGGHVELALLLLERGANIEEVNDEGYTPLMEAAREGHEEMVALLLSQGADINAQTEETQETALTLACCGGFLEVSDFLIKAGACIEIGASTPLMEAAQEGHLDLVKYLISAGANIHAQTQSGDTALTYACENGHTDVADVLLQAGADLEHLSEGGRTPLMKAGRAGHLCTVQFLIARGADVNRTTANNDHTALSLACGGGHLQVVELLLSSGSDPFHKLKDNCTMLIEASKGGHSGVVQLLLDYPRSMMGSPPPLDPPGTGGVEEEGGGGGGGGLQVVSAPVVNDAGLVPVMGSVQVGVAHTPVAYLPAFQCPTQVGDSFLPVSGNIPASSSLGSTSLSDYQMNAEQFAMAVAATQLAIVPTTTMQTTSSSLSQVMGAGDACSTNYLVGSNPADSNNQVLDESGALDELMPHKHLEACLSSAMKKVEQLQQLHQQSKEEQLWQQNREAQIQQKLQILEELQKVERELQERTQAQLLLNASLSNATSSQLQQLQQQHQQTAEQNNAVLSALMAAADNDLNAITSGAFAPAATFNPAVNFTFNSAAGFAVPLTLATGTSCFANFTPASTTTSSTFVAPTTLTPSHFSPPFGGLSQEIQDRPKAKAVSKKDMKTKQKAAQAAAAASNEFSLHQSDLMNMTLAFSDANKAAAAAGVTSPGAKTIAPVVAVTSTTTNKLSNVSVANMVDGSSSNTATNQSAKGKLPQTNKDPKLLDGATSKQPIGKTHDPALAVSSARSHHPVNFGPVTSSSNQSASGALKQPMGKVPSTMAPVAKKLAMSTTTTTAQGKNQLSSVPVQIPAQQQTTVTTSLTTTNIALQQPLPDYQQLLANPQQLMAMGGATVELGTLQLDPEQLASLTSAMGAVCGTNVSFPLTVPVANMAGSVAASSQLVLTQQQLAVQIAQGLAAANSIVASAVSPNDANSQQVLQLQRQYIHAALAAAQFGTDQQGLALNANSVASASTPFPFMPKYPVPTQLSQQATEAIAQSLVTAPPPPPPVTQPAPVAPPAPVSASVQPLATATAASQTCVAPPLPQLVPNGAPGVTLEVDSQTESNHDTALTLACAGGHEELVQLLLGRNANIEHRDKKGFTPLILAATAGHSAVVEALLNHTADIEAQSERTKDTPLSLACSGGRYEVVEILLARGSNKEHRNVSDYTPLSLAASGGYVNIIKLLLAHGAEINSRTGSKLGISPLMLAAMNGHTAAVKLLLDMGSDINAQIETNRNTALTLACFQGRHEVVSLLVDRKANVEHRAKTGLSPLMEAASGGYVEVGRVLLDKGADVNAPAVPSSRDTALTIAADKGHYRFVELLLTRGAQVDVKNKKGNSPLWLAANGGHLDVVQLLVNARADIDSQDNRKVSCLMSAFRKGHVKVAKWMVKNVTQFPSDQEMTRYLQTITDKEFLRKCHQCMDIIRIAKERQAAEANKNAIILLEELDMEKTKEENKKAAAARRRERKKKKKQEKKVVEVAQESDDEDEEEEEEEPIPAARNDRVLDKSASAKNLARGGKKPVAADEYFTSDDESEGSEDPANRGKSAVQSKTNNVKSVESNLRRTNEAKAKTTKEPIKVNSRTLNGPTQLTDSAKAKKENKENKNAKHRVSTVTITTASTTTTASSFITVTKTTQSGTSSVILSTSNSSAGSGKRLKDCITPLTIQLPAEDDRSRGKADVKEPLKSPLTTLLSNLKSPPSTRRNAGGATSNRRVEGEGGWKEVTRRSKKILVPSNAISRVIGRAGCNINAIREVSGAHIEVEKQKGNQVGDRTITVKGSADATRQAHQLISALIKEPDRELMELLPKAAASKTAQKLAAFQAIQAHQGTVFLNQTGAAGKVAISKMAPAMAATVAANSIAPKSLYSVAKQPVVTVSTQIKPANAFPTPQVWNNSMAAGIVPVNSKKSSPSSNSGQKAVSTSSGTPAPLATSTSNASTPQNNKNVSRQLFPKENKSHQPTTQISTASTKATVSYTNAVMSSGVRSVKASSSTTVSAAKPTESKMTPKQIMSASAKPQPATPSSLSSIIDLPGPPPPILMPPGRENNGVIGSGMKSSNCAIGPIGNQLVQTQANQELGLANVNSSSLQLPISSQLAAKSQPTTPTGCSKMIMTSSSAQSIQQPIRIETQRAMTPPANPMAQEYSPFNNLFSKVAQQSVWGGGGKGGENNKNINFASMASPSLQTDELQVPDAAKAPGYRGNLHVSPGSNYGLQSSNSAPTTPPIAPIGPPNKRSGSPLPVNHFDNGGGLNQLNMMSANSNVIAHLTSLLSGNMPAPIGANRPMSAFSGTERGNSQSGGFMSMDKAKQGMYNSQQHQNSNSRPIFSNLNPNAPDFSINRPGGVVLPNFNRNVPPPNITVPPPPMSVLNRQQGRDFNRFGSQQFPFGNDGEGHDSMRLISSLDLYSGPPASSNRTVGHHQDPLHHIVHSGSMVGGKGFSQQSGGYSGGSGHAPSLQRSASTTPFMGNNLSGQDDSGVSPHGSGPSSPTSSTSSSNPTSNTIKTSSNSGQDSNRQQQAMQQQSQQGGNGMKAIGEDRRQIPRPIGTERANRKNPTPVGGVSLGNMGKFPSGQSQGGTGIWSGFNNAGLSSDWLTTVAEGVMAAAVNNLNQTPNHYQRPMSQDDSILGGMDNGSNAYLQRAMRFGSNSNDMMENLAAFATRFDNALMGRGLDSHHGMPVPVVQNSSFAQTPFVNGLPPSVPMQNLHTASGPNSDLWSSNPGSGGVVGLTKGGLVGHSSDILSNMHPSLQSQHLQQPVAPTVGNDQKTVWNSWTSQ